MTTVIILLTIVLTISHFYMKCTLLLSFCTLIIAVLSTALAFNFYEILADLFISRGYGGNWAPAGCFLLVYVLGQALFRSLADMLLRSELDLGKPARHGAAVVCGFLTGLIIAGNVLVVMGLMPVQHALIYSRFPADSNRAIILNNPTTPIVNLDGFVTGMFGWLSRGALSSNRSFAVVQADYLNKIHINKRAIKDDVYPVASSESLRFPPRDKRPVRLWPSADRGDLIAVRVGIVTDSISEGGAEAGAGEVRFALSQARLIYKDADDADNLRGVGQAVLPTGLLQYRNPARPLDGKQFVEKQLEDVIGHDDGLTLRDDVLWLDVVFSRPDQKKPVMFQFKKNVSANLIGYEPVASTPEIEEVLDMDKEEEEETD